MAAFGLHPQPRASDQPASPSIAPNRQLPRGSCHWRDLNLGQAASACGCKQFWLNDTILAFDQSPAQPGSAGAWCFCGHHACFHSVKSDTFSDAIPQQQYQQTPDFHAPPAWNFNDALALDLDQAPDQANAPPAFAYSSSQSKQPNLNASALGLLIAGDTPQFNHTTTTSSQLPLKPNFLQHAAAANLPSTQCSSPKPASNYTSDAEFRPPHTTPNTNLIGQIAHQRNDHPRVNVHNLPGPNPHDDTAQSVTEVATPSIAGTPALHRDNDDPFSTLRATLDAFNRQAQQGAMGSPTNNIQALNKKSCNQAQPQHLSPTTLDQLMQEISSLKKMMATTPALKTSLTNLQSRIQALESTSFLHVPADEIHDKFEHFDTRMLDIETRVDEIEKTQAVQSDDTISKSTPSFGSKGSFNTQDVAGRSHTMDLCVTSQSSAALLQLAQLEQRLSSIENSAMPRPTAPWHVEVVFIPWGWDMTGVWGASFEDSQPSRQDGQHPASASASVPSQSGTLVPEADDKAAVMTHSQLGAIREWTNGSPHWLSPRACGPFPGTAGRVYERLKSRGFVRNVTLYENSAKEVQARIMAAFGNFGPAMTASNNGPLQSRGRHAEVLGLTASFIPLRKVHKSSRLRHLAEAELVTPSLWTPEFLNFGVFMQTPTTGHRRLFVTTPQGYLQGRQDLSSSWNWQKLRELPRYHPNDTDELMVGEADANEPCWAWNPRLDPAISIHSSFASSLSYHSSLDSKPLSPLQTNGPSSGLPSNESVASKSDQDEHEQKILNAQNTDGSYEKGGRLPITPTSDFPSGRTHNGRRATSQPPTQMEPSPTLAMSKRQFASFEQASLVKDFPKRRRFSRNTDGMDLEPEWNLTPRPSHEPISPHRRNSTSRPIIGHHNYDEATQAVVGKRGITPQAYATPFSGDIFMAGPYVEMDQDTDIDDSDDIDEDDWDTGDIELDEVSVVEGPDEDEDEDEDDEAWEGVDDEEHEQ